MRCVSWIVVVALAVWSFAAESAEPIVVTLNKSHILRLNQDVAFIITNNPSVLAVEVDSQRMVIMQGMGVGEAQVIFLDQAHKEILTTNVVVTPELERHVFITRHCGDGAGACAAEEELSCGPRCVRVAAPGPGPATSGGNGGGGGGMSGAAADPGLDTAPQ